MGTCVFNAAWLDSVSIANTGCTGCKCPPSDPPATPFDVEIHEMELCTVLKAQECAAKAEKNLTDLAMDDAPPEDEDGTKERNQNMGRQPRNDSRGMESELRNCGGKTRDSNLERKLSAENTHLPELSELVTM